MRAEELDVGSSPRELIENAFFGLRLVSPALERSAIDYVLTGSPRSFPASVTEATRAQVNEVFPALSRSNRHSRLDHGARWTAIRPDWTPAHSEESRRRLYVNLAAIDRADDAIIARLGRALAAFGEPSDWLPAGVPVSILTLLTDAVSLGGAHGPDTLSSFTIERLRSLVRLEGVSAKAVDRVLLTLLIDRRGGYHHGTLHGLGLLPGIAQFAEAHIVDLREVVADFDAAGQMELFTHAMDAPGLAAGILDWIIANLGSRNEDMRPIAQSAIRGVSPAVAMPHLEAAAIVAPAAELVHLVAAIETSADPGLAVQTLQRVRGARARKDQLLDKAIDRTTIFAMAPVTADASIVDRVDVPPLEPGDEPPLGDAWIDEAIPHIDRAIARLTTVHERELRYEEAKPGSRDATHWARVVDSLRHARERIGDIERYLSGMGPHPGQRVVQSLHFHVGADALRLSPVQRVRLAAQPGSRAGLHWVAPGADPRVTVQELQRLGFSRDESVVAISRKILPDWGRSESVAPASAWPFMMEHPRVFDAVLGIRAGDSTAPLWQKDAVLAILEVGPVLPARYLPFVAAMATAAAKTNRPAAQRVLEKHGVAHSLAEFALRDGAADVRRGAVEWVSRLGGTWASGLLRTALASEPNETVRASILTAVEVLGDDISAYLTPPALLDEARGGLAKKAPSNMAWFPFDDVPQCRFESTGELVPPEVVRWWIVLAARLKDPLGVGLIPRYVALLDQSSREELGGFILSAWLTRDLTPPDDEQVMLRAMAEVSRHWKRVRRMLQQPDESVIDIFDPGVDLDDARRRVERTAPSAIGEKGILALCGGAPGPELARIARDYMRGHHLKRAQIEALVQLLALSDDAAALQLLLATARRHRTPSVQVTARAMVEVVAARTGWSADELADRMVPTAGLDDAAEVAVDYGRRAFTIRLSAALAVEIVDDDGAVIRALPAPRASDDAGAVKAAKATLKATKSDVSALLSVQRSRLYEAMCLQRVWTASDWRTYVLAHPVMLRLAAQLVWSSESPDGAIRLVRPCLDGSIVDASNREVEVAESAAVRIAHGAVMDAAAVAIWTSHLAATGLVPVFDQFGAEPPAVTHGQSELSHLEGAETETFRLRSRATARGYSRGQTGDNANFEDYVKAFEAAGLVARVSFSGSSVPEESAPVTMGALTVHHRVGTRLGAEVDLSQLPSVLLAELAADYDHLADPL